MPKLDDVDMPLEEDPDKLCCVCRESTSYPGFNPKARLKPGSILGPACFKRVYDKFDNGELLPGARDRLERSACQDNEAVTFDTWTYETSCLHSKRAATPGRVKITCSLCGFMESARHVRTDLLRKRHYNKAAESTNSSNSGGGGKTGSNNAPNATANPPPARDLCKSSSARKDRTRLMTGSSTPRNLARDQGYTEVVKMPQRQQRQRLGQGVVKRRTGQHHQLLQQPQQQQFQLQQHQYQLQLQQQQRQHLNHHMHRPGYNHHQHQQQLQHQQRMLKNHQNPLRRVAMKNNSSLNGVDPMEAFDYSTTFLGFDHLSSSESHSDMGDSDTESDGTRSDAGLASRINGLRAAAHSSVDMDSDAEADVDVDVDVDVDGMDTDADADIVAAVRKFDALSHINLNSHNHQLSRSIPSERDDLLDWAFMTEAQFLACATADSRAPFGEEVWLDCPPSTSLPSHWAPSSFAV